MKNKIAVYLNNRQAKSHMNELLLIILFSFMPGNAKCQADAGQCEVSLSAGLSWLNGVDRIFDPNPKSSAITIASFKYQVTHGFAINLEGNKKIIHNVVNSEIILLSLLPGVVFTYFDRTNTPNSINAKLYGAFSLGVNYEESSPWWYPDFPAVKITPLGVRVGKSFAGFMEIGFGGEWNSCTFQYMRIEMGMNYRFPNKSEGSY